jgi:type II secretory pathway pseudopilin PulG
MGMVLVIVVLALLLAVGFFFLTHQRRDDAGGRALTDAADTVDNATRSIGDAAQRTVDRLRDRDPKKD